jgi:hypothetical protein
MTATAIREKLYDYIRVADDKKVAAIYNLLEDQIEEYTDWHKDKIFVAELDARISNWENNPDNVSSMDDIDTAIEHLKQDRSAK